MKDDRKNFEPSSGLNCGLGRGLNSGRKILLFAGTTEGRLLSEYLLKLQWPAVVCVATEYGKDVLDDTFRDPDGKPTGDHLDIRQGRLETSAMKALLDEIQPGLVIDATHPYAVAVTENIRKACGGREDLRLIRCLRESGVTACGQAAVGSRELPGGRELPGKRDLLASGGMSVCAGPEIVHVPDVEAAVMWLAAREGNILVTTGSKDLGAYCGIKDFRQRIYARVLPSSEAVRVCSSLGYEGRHIIAMQGPFSEYMNLAQLKEYDCRYLVTKDGGAAGGFTEKLRAAAGAGAAAVVIDRPDHGEGISLDTVKVLVKEWIDHEKR